MSHMETVELRNEKKKKAAFGTEVTDEIMLRPCTRCGLGAVGEI